MPASENFLQVQSHHPHFTDEETMAQGAPMVQIFDNYNANLHTGEFNGLMNGEMDISFPKPHSKLNSGSYDVYTFRSHPQL